MIELTAIALLCVSNTVTGAFLFMYRRRLKESQNMSRKELTQDANELLGQLLSGNAVVVLQTIDPNYLMLHSPRDAR